MRGKRVPEYPQSRLRIACLVNSVTHRSVLFIGKQDGLCVVSRRRSKSGQGGPQKPFLKEMGTASIGG